MPNETSNIKCMVIKIHRSIFKRSFYCGPDHMKIIHKFSGMNIQSITDKKYIEADKKSRKKVSECNEHNR